MKNSLLLIAFILIFSSCKDTEIKELSNDVCKCFTKKESEYSKTDNSGKKHLIQTCFSSKIKELAEMRHEEFLKSGKKSNILDHTFEVTMNVTKHLNQNCEFFQKNKNEITELLKEKPSTDNDKNKEKGEKIIGEIVGIEKLEYEAANIKIKLETGEIKDFFYKQVPKHYIGKMVEAVFEVKVIESDTLNWIKRLEVK